MEFLRQTVAGSKLVAGEVLFVLEEDLLQGLDLRQA
jgi:hypothetical protein